jgi:biopolymer transport protein ExbD
MAGSSAAAGSHKTGIHPAGPRLYSSIPFRHLGAGAKGGRKGANVYLNVTPFVDMMTILVTFLMMVFSASGELISVQRGMVLPSATRKEELKKAPIIIVTRDAITFNGQLMGDPNAIMEDSSMEHKIIELFDRLRAEKTAFRMNGFEQLSDLEKEFCRNPKPDPLPEEVCLDGLVIMQADKETNAKVINRIIKTAYDAEYPNIMFAVNRRDRRE